MRTHYWRRARLVGSLLALLALVPRQALADNPTITLNPTSGPVNTVVSVTSSSSGAICPLFVVVQPVVWDGQQTVGEVQGNPCIGWTGSFTIPPDAIPGLHLVFTQSASGQTGDLERFLVIASLTQASPTATPTPTAPTGEPPGATGVYRVRPDLRLCPSPLCGGAFASLVNQPTTQCVDGVDRAACYLASIDFSALNLSDTQLSLFRTALFADHALVQSIRPPTTIAR